MNVAISLALVLFVMTLNSRAGTRDEQWKKVDDAVRQGLPRTAITNLEPIIRAAVRDQAWAEAAKAILRRAVIESTIQGNRPEERIKILENEINSAPSQTIPILRTALAHWYWDYFRQNRWRFMRRTPTTGIETTDFTTWDLPRLFSHIDKLFAEALSAHETLKAIPIGAWDDLLEKGTVPDSYRPTLYDFIAHEALQFYTSGEQAAALPQDAFEISSDSPVFDPIDTFLAWDAAAGVSSEARQSPALKAIRIYQELLRFHQNDNEPSARLDVDLARLTWAANVAFGETKNTRYKAALKRIAEQEGDHELASIALFKWAEVVRAEGDLAEARNLAIRGARIHPNSAGGKLCSNLVAEIEAKSASIVTERLWSPPWPTIQVRYRNITNVWFRLVSWNWDEFLERRHHRPESLDEKERAAVLGMKPDYAWSHTLPPTTNYQTATVEVPVPANLKHGFYFLLASCNPDFTQQDNQLSIADIWVSDLTFVTRPRPGRIEGFVLEANSGEPVENAKVEGWRLDRNGNRVPIKAAATDSNGLFSLQTSEDRPLLLKITARGQTVASSSEYTPAWDVPKPQPYERTVFFTDRALYRPGQIIQYKGICIDVDRDHDNYQTIGGREVTVVFADANGKEIARQQHKSNAYGSFSGSFVAPSGRLTGQMCINVVGGPPGTTWVRVEEYKRPKFQVTLDAPKEAPRLEEMVSVGGRAMSYTGAAVDGAKVTYRVVRLVRMPWWWRGYRAFASPWIRSPSQEIAHGSTTTGADGTFNIRFKAIPDRRVPEKDDPRFIFQVNVDVTDSAGETRSCERSVYAGYTALEARISFDDWQVEGRPVELKLRTTSLDGEPQSVEGAVRVHMLKSPSKVERRPLYSEGDYWEVENISGEGSADVGSWQVGEVVLEEHFATDNAGNAAVTATLKAGAYRVAIETKDRFGKQVETSVPLLVLQPEDTTFRTPIPFYVAAPKWKVEPGEEFVALFGTGYDKGRAYVEIEHRGKLIKAYWTNKDETQARISQVVAETMRGGFDLRVTFVRENRAYFESKHVEVPWTNKEFKVRWEHFTSKLDPGGKETWTAVIEPAQPVSSSTQSAESIAAEMVATLYDRSLDQFLPFGWPNSFGVFNQETRYLQQLFGNEPRQFQTFHQSWRTERKPVNITYRRFPEEIISFRQFRLLTRASEGGTRVRPVEVGAAETFASPAAAPMVNALEEKTAPTGLDFAAAKATAGGAPDDLARPSGATETQGKPALDTVVARRVLSETAFFFPHLVSDTNGHVRISFTVPEALTEWRFLGFAHDRTLRAGFLEDSAVTAKELMVQPNPPRFLREGDLLEFAVKVMNQSDRRQQGVVRLTLADAWSGQSADLALNNVAPEKNFDLGPRESASFSWPLRVPEGLTALSYKAVAATATLSDGEEAMLPVLTRRVLVTESLPLAIRGRESRTFEFAKLAESGKSSTLRHQSLTVQMVSNPAWYAVLALPYLMEYPYQCSEQVFNRYYANALARFIANSDPKIRRVFELWKGAPALESPLEKNRELKAVALEESPWLCRAQDETQARRNIGVLFDENRLDAELARAFEELKNAQLPDGAWSWFPGGPPNDYITLYICTGFGRLRHLGLDVNVDPALRALQRLDSWLDQSHKEILRQKTEDRNHLTSMVALHLYGRSFFMEERPIAAAVKPAFNFFIGQAREYWPKLESRQSQAHIALALKRLGDTNTADAIVRSLKERSVTDVELGRFWRDTELSWWWYRAPIETQALMIEAFAEIANDTKAVEECKVWLLKQKQTQDWKTTKATADAVYALLLRGQNLLENNQLVEISVANIRLTPDPSQKTELAAIEPVAFEPGTGFFERRFVGAEVRPDMSWITVRKTTDGIAWGSVHWQYFEDIGKIAPYEGTPLKLRKALFTKVNTASGSVLRPVAGPVSVGDELVVRIELRVDRDMEYVHLKDHRGSGVEPVNVLSRYKYQDGLGYYESTRDTASHFFVDYLPKGTYVFEYPLRVQHRGEYQTGVTSIQCLYAPEFNSHSESFTLKVQ